MVTLGIVGFIVLAAGAAMTSPTVVHEPLITWNLFLTAGLVPLSVMILYGAIVRQFKARDLRDAKIAELMKEAETTKAVMIKERYDNFANTLCHVKEKIEEIAAAQQDRVTWEHCNDVHKELRRDLKELNGRTVI